MKKNILIFLLFSIFNLFPNSNVEKIYAIMITGKDDFHYPLAQNAIKSFLLQTYQNKHLIIINDGDYTLIENDPQITEIKLEKQSTLGRLRNIGLSYVPNNSIWVQWDDDDWHHPKLIESQYNYLKSKNSDCCLLKYQIRYAFSKNFAWIGKVNQGIHGTIMCRKKNDIKYPDIRKGEDTIFLKAYRKKYSVVSWKNPTFYYLRFIHNHNTWENEHFKLDKKPKNFWNIKNQDKDYLKQILKLYDFLGY